jgi:hypothetical protein
VGDAPSRPTLGTPCAQRKRLPRCGKGGVQRKGIQATKRARRFYLRFCGVFCRAWGVDTRYSGSPCVVAGLHLVRFIASLIPLLPGRVASVHGKVGLEGIDTCRSEAEGHP